MSKLRQFCVAAALATTASGAALAETTGTIGIMSDYIWRGQYVSDASAYGSIDINTDSGIYLGLWGADIVNGLEYDLYAGYAGGTENISWNVGWTGYFATDEAFDTLEEINIGFSVGFLSIDYSLGRAENSAGILPNGRVIDQTYEYVITTVAPDVGPYYVIGRSDYHNLARDFPATGANGYWFEVGKDFEVMDDLEIGFSVIYSPDVQPNLMDTTPRSIFLSATNPLAEYAFVMHLSKSFSINN